MENKSNEIITYLVSVDTVQINITETFSESWCFHEPFIVMLVELNSLIVRQQSIIKCEVLFFKPVFRRGASNLVTKGKKNRNDLV